MLQDLVQRIVGEDRTGAAFDSVRAKMRGLDDQSSALSTRISGIGTMSRQAFNSIALGATVAGAAVAAAVKNSIDHADALSKASQKAGVTVEALSRLEYAAKLSDLSLEQLTGGLGKLNKGMVAVAEGMTGGLAVTFADLGISVTTASGQLRSADAVMLDLADAFDGIPDGAKKSALAIELFGKSGADLIPLLNSGRDGLKEMYREADVLGQTFSTSTAQGAERFNDSMTRVQAGLGGLSNTIARESLPLLNDLADALTDERFNTAGQTLLGNLMEGLRGPFQQLLKGTIRDIEILAALTSGDWEGTLTPQRRIGGQTNALRMELENYNFAKSQGIPLDYAQNDMGTKVRYGDLLQFAGISTSASPAGAAARPAATQAPASANYADGLDMSWVLGGGADMAAGMGGGGGFGAPVVAGLGQVGKALEGSKSDMASWAEAFDSEINRTGASMDGLARQAEMAWTGTADMVASGFDAMAQLVGSSSAEAFETSKKLQMASAIVTGISATVAAYKAGWETGPITGPALSVLWGGMAAGVAAAKVATIAGTSFGAGAMPSGGGGGGAAAAPAKTAAAPAGGGGQTQGITIVLRGNGRYSADEVRGLLQDINEHLYTQGKKIKIGSINGDD